MGDNAQDDRADNTFNVLNLGTFPNQTEGINELGNLNAFPDISQKLLFFK